MVGIATGRAVARSTFCSASGFNHTGGRALGQKHRFSCAVNDMQVRFMNGGRAMDLFEAQLRTVSAREGRGLI